MSPEKTQRIVDVLRHTDLTINEIAERFRCSTSAIKGINVRHKVRKYLGLRNRWILVPYSAAEKGPWKGEAGRRVADLNPHCQPWRRTPQAEN
jgi:hypothetical protein